MILISSSFIMMGKNAFDHYCSISFKHNINFTIKWEVACFYSTSGQIPLTSGYSDWSNGYPHMRYTGSASMIKENYMLPLSDYR